MTRSPARRPAFTLIELLVVIALIVILVGLAASVFGRVRVSQQKAAADATLTKINSLIERRWKAVNDQVADDAKNNHPGYAAVLSAVQNVDLAKALWTHAKMKNEFPMSLNEARVDTPVIGAIVIPRKASFSPTVIPMGAAGGSPEESAALLYIAVTANAGGGTAVEGDGIQQQIGDSGVPGLKCFVDPWGTPIAFVRTAYNAEVSGPPFVRAGAGQQFDPFDPLRKLTAFAAGNPAWWTATRAPVTWVAIPATYPGLKNHVPTALSAGPNKQWWGPLGTPAVTDIYGLPPLPDSDAAKDNQLSYRLRREGARGD